MEKNHTDFFQDYHKLQEIEHLYNSAIKQLQLKFDVLNDEFRVKFARSPIHHVESRLKSTTSIINKLQKLGLDVTMESAMKNLNDMAGLRVVCCYIDDVYKVSDMLLRQSDIKLVKMQDYIKEPNYNGYRSLHLDIELPVYLSDRTMPVRAEVQLRTVAMDFWASLEHDLRYKSSKKIPKDICLQMHDCADEIAHIDHKMQEIYKKIQKL